MTQFGREMAWLAFGRAVVAVGPYLSAVSVHRPEQANAILWRLGREMAYLPQAAEHQLRRYPNQGERQ